MSDRLLIHDLLHRLEVAGMEPAVSWKGGELKARPFMDLVRARAASFQMAGIGKGDRVAIWLPKGPRAVECLLAALICGAVGVPTDPMTPPERAARIFADVNPGLIVIDERRRKQLNALQSVSSSQWHYSMETAFGDSPDSAEPGTQFQPPPVTTDDVAMILMTSGTTGVPKGVVVTHGNITAFSNWAITTFTLGADDIFANIAPLHFDLSVLDVLTSLRIGASVRLIDEKEARFPMDLADALEAASPSILYSVPTMYQRLLYQGRLGQREMSALRWILFAGEPFPAPALGELMTAMRHPGYANLYGPTETNVVACKILETAPDQDEVPNIGSACGPSRVMICDDKGEALRFGDTGEICVQGPTVMQGYWNREDLTIACYFDDRRDVFRTGDFGYFDPAGDLRFVGRRDRQIKLAGYRIDLGEVESVALQSGLVRAVAATVRDAVSIRLHVVATGESGLDLPLLGGWMRRFLPRYAIPAEIVEIEEMPVSVTGKVDYERLVSDMAERDQERGSTE